MNNNNNTIWSFFIVRHRFTTLILIVAVLFGLFSMIQIPKESSPEVNIPFVIVSTPYPGASAQDVEELVTTPIENKLLNLPGVKNVQSSSSEGFSSVTVEFDVKEDPDKQKSKVQDKVDEVKPDLPSEAQDPIVSKIEASEEPIYIFAFSGPYDRAALNSYAEQLKDELEKIGDVAGVNIIGGQQRELQVLVDKAKLDGFNLSISQVTQAISQANADIPVGSLESAGSEYNLRLAGRILSPDQIGNIPVAVFAGSPVLVKDVASVVDGYKKSSTLSRLSLGGEPFLPSLTISVSKVKGGNILRAVEQVEKTIEDAKANFLPENVETEIIMDMGDFINQDINTLFKNGLQTILLVGLLLAFFIGLKEAILAGLAVPFSFLITFIFLPVFGLTINFLSLFSLILALGILIDTAIVVVERINVYLEEGDKTPKEAAILTVKEFQWPLIVGTLTTVFAFLPMLLMSGIMGQYVRFIPITVTIVLLSSLFVGLAITPALAARRFKGGRTLKKLNGHLQQKLSRNGNGDEDFLIKFKKAVSERSFAWLLEKYKSQLASLMDNKKKRRWLYVGIFVALVFSLALPATGVLKVNMFPAEDMEFFSIGVELPTDSPLEDTDEVVKQIQEVLRPEVKFKSLVANTGLILFSQSFTGSNSGENVAEIIVNLNDKEDSKEMIARYQRILDEEIRNARVVASQLGSGPPSGAPIDIAIQGESLEELEKTAKDLEEVLKSIPGAKNAQTNIREAKGEFVMEIDRVKAQLQGISTIQLASVLRNAVSGSKATTLKVGGEDLDVLVRYNLFAQNFASGQSEKISINDLESLTITTPQGLTPLSSFVTTTLQGGRQAIRHEDGLRTYRLQAQAEDSVTPIEVIQGFQEKAADYVLPAGVKLSYGGEQQDLEQSYNDMFRAMILAVFLIASILILQFRSWRQPIFILLTIPLSLIGVFPGLTLIGKALSFPAIVGVVALAGIVVNNGIILVDMINRNRKEKNLERREAILDAGATRFRPILLTTLTTVIGILPISFSSALWGGLGFAIIFGLLASSFLTLFIVPLVYYRFAENELE